MIKGCFCKLSSVPDSCQDPWSVYPKRLEILRTLQGYSIMLLIH